MTLLLAQLGNWLLLIGAVLFGIAVYNAARAGRQSRSGAYYATREDALSKTRRWSLIAVVAFIATSGLALYLAGRPFDSTAVARTGAPPPARVTVPSGILPTATSTAHPTVPPSPTSLPTSTWTPIPLPTATFPPDLPDILRTPVPSAVPVSPNAKLSFTTLASVVDNKGNPINPGLAFPSGTRSVRLFFQASSVNNGAVWSVICYKDNQLVDNVVDLWKW